MRQNVAHFIDSQYLGFGEQKQKVGQMRADMFEFQSR